MASSAPFFLAVTRGEAEPEALAGVAAANAAFLASDPERRPSVLAERHAVGEEALLAYVDEVVGDPVVEAFRGVRVPLSTLLAVELSEVLVHGHDIARAAGLAWPVERAHAAVAADGLLPAGRLPPVGGSGGVPAAHVCPDGALAADAAGQVVGLGPPPLAGRLAPQALREGVTGRSSPAGAVASGATVRRGLPVLPCPVSRPGAVCCAAP